MLISLVILRVQSMQQRLSGEMQKCLQANQSFLNQSYRIYSGIDLPDLDSGIDCGIDSWTKVSDLVELDSMLREASLWRMQNLV
ncbi:unnamed protein product [Arabis nemorensis]|uniref:Uncharacterized protein n=1 Tax=Arabis nemorensis TaxID=586526 RepID=A0A565BFC9_9BRAS|nr:unnamed protein product [Arabis nemorensis]